MSKQLWVQASWHPHIFHHGFLSLTDDCVTMTDGDQAFNENVPVPVMKWFETPSVVQYGAGNFP